MYYIPRSWNRLSSRAVSRGMVMPVTVEYLAVWDADLRALTDGLVWLFQRPIVSRRVV